MAGQQRTPAPFTHSLSARLLVLTIFFVMISEVLIYAPSVARFRQSFLEERIAAAHLATLALEAMPNHAVSPELQQRLLERSETYHVVLRTPKRHMFALGAQELPSIDATYDLRVPVFFGWLADALVTLVQTENRVLRVIAPSPKDPGTVVEILMDEAPMRQAMYDFSVRILALSLIISAITASLVFLALRWLMVRPMERITESMMKFRADPENAEASLPPGDRVDEIGVAQRELGVMQQEVRQALRQRRRLAALGSAVAKINHDLRNSLATAVLVSDRLADSDDPEVRRLVPRLFEAIDRAVELCSQTLNFAREGAPKMETTRFALADLVEEVGEGIRNSELGVGGLVWHNEVSPEIQVDADRDQIFRALTNVGRNAFQAGAKSVTARAESRFGFICLSFTDDGPGIPQQARENLFAPFAGSTKKDGTGLGLVIVRDIMRAHGGDVTLGSTNDDGTTFLLELPARIEEEEGEEKSFVGSR